MNYKLLLAIDPSGNFNEGKGTTGFCFYDCEQKKVLELDSLSATDFTCMESYWEEHLAILDYYGSNHRENIGFVIEDYVLYGNKAQEQTNSRFETSKLIGAMQLHLWQEGAGYHMQLASEVKTRWADPILSHKGIIVPCGRGYKLPDHTKLINRHCKDSIRHAVHFATFKNLKGIVE